MQLALAFSRSMTLLEFRRLMGFLLTWLDFVVNFLELGFMDLLGRILLLEVSL